MRAFRFRLQRVLDVRRHRLERARLELAGARQRLDARAAELRALEARVEHAIGMLRGELRSGLRAGALVARQQGIEHLRADREEAREAWEKTRVELATVRSRVVEAQRAVRVLERLREHAQGAYRLELGRHEQRELDEVGVQAWGRREATR